MTDTAASSAITDHPYTNFKPIGQTWERCSICHLSEAAHITTLVAYVWPDFDIYRCPYCVDRRVKPCPHGREGALDLKAQPLRA